MIESNGNRAEAIVGLMPRLAQLGHSTRVLVEIRQLWEQSRFSDNTPRTDALVSVAPYLPEEHLAEALEIARTVEYSIGRAEALAALAHRLAQLPSDCLYPPWQDTLYHLAQRTRKDLVADLHALIPVIVALGKVEAIKETYQAIEDVGRWWP